MDDRTPAHDLPTLYRAVLDTVSRLERIGERQAGWQIRRDALKVYSTQWDQRGCRRLERIHRDAVRRLASHPKAASLGTLTATSEPA